MRFTVEGPPVAWKRARRRGNRYFIDPDEDAHRKKIALLAKQAGAKVLEGPVSMFVDIGCEWPRSKWRKRNPRGSEWCPVKPDSENVLKLLKDALEGVCFKNDSQVCWEIVWKRYVPQGEPARTVVQVWGLGTDLDPTTHVDSEGR